jgi:hypothetical protein
MKKKENETCNDYGERKKKQKNIWQCDKKININRFQNINEIKYVCECPIFGR